MSEKLVPITAGAGTNIRTFELTLLQSDGTRKTIEMQAMVISDDQGNIIGLKNAPLYVDSERIVGLLEKLIDEVQNLNALMASNIN